MSTDLAYRILGNGKVVITGRGNCTDKNIVIPDKIDGYIVTAIDADAFRYDKDLVSMQVANTIVHIGDCAFYECKNLKYLKIPQETYIVGDHAFSCCNKLQHIIFGCIDQLEWFGKDVFYCSKNIKTIEINR